MKLTRKVSNGYELTISFWRYEDMKKNPGRKERRRLMFQNRRAAGKQKAKLHDNYMKQMARKGAKTA